MQREVVGRRARHTDAADSDLRLRGIGLVDQVNLSGSGLLRRRQRFGRLRRRRSSPRPEARFERRQDFLRRDVADRDQRGVVRPVHRRIESLEIIGGERLDGLGRPERRRAVSTGRAVQHAHRSGRADRRRIVAGLKNRRQPLLPQPLEFVGRKRRPQRDVGHDR